MSAYTKIQWCDSTVNPIMGCPGCELWDETTKRCYAGTLHERFGGVSPGYAPTFEEVTQFPGRMAKAAAWSDLDGSRREGSDKRVAKPWLNGFPRMIFVSDMGDSLATVVPFEFLQKEVYNNVVSKNGQRHIWLWLTKRPERMRQFFLHLTEQGLNWPDNLWPGTSVTTQKSTSRVESLKGVGGRTTTRFLSVEPQWESVTLNLEGVGWVIQGGESGTDPKPFDMAWAYEIMRQCSDAGVPYFLKQLGGHVLRSGRRLYFRDDHGGDWHEWTEGLRVRQIPRK